MRTAALVLLAMLGLSSIAHAQTYELVINNGRVIDPETRHDAVRNIGIKNGRIKVVTDTDITCNETIDASRHVVAPGFIDFHWHGFAQRQVPGKLRRLGETPSARPPAPDEAVSRRPMVTWANYDRFG